MLVENYERDSQEKKTTHYIQSYWNKYGEQTVKNGTGLVDSLYETKKLPYTTGVKAQNSESN